MTTSRSRTKTLKTRTKKIPKNLPLRPPLARSPTLIGTRSPTGTGMKRTVLAKTSPAPIPIRVCRDTAVAEAEAEEAVRVARHLGPVDKGVDVEESARNALAARVLDVGDQNEAVAARRRNLAVPNLAARHQHAAKLRPIVHRRHLLRLP